MEEINIPQILAVNRGQVIEVSEGRKQVRTGIFKHPANGPVRVGALGLEGDQQADLENHGGIDKAVYAYPFEHYAFWQQELGRTDFQFGQFGENLTIRGLLEAGAHVGDVFRCGSVTLQVTQPRVPCYKLGIRMKLAGFPKLFASSGRTGFYLRVLSGGELRAGDSIEALQIEKDALTVVEMMQAMHFDKENMSLLKKAVASRKMTPEWLEEFEKRLAARGRI